MNEDGNAEDPAVKARRDEVIALRASDLKADIDSRQTMQTNLYAVAVSALDRVKVAAETVQKSATAIITIYTGILAFAFTAAGTQLPLRGLLAPLFLGGAIVLSTAYLAYVVPPPNDALMIQGDVEGNEPKSFARLNAFIDYTSELAGRRAWLLRSSVMALGVGLVYISLPFIQGAQFFGDHSVPDATHSSITWPMPDQSLPEKYSLLLYQKQVDEAAAARAMVANATSPPPESLMPLIAMLVIGASIVVLGAWLPGRERGNRFFR